MSRYEQILQSATEFAVIVTDRNGTVTDWNTGAERILGWTAAEMVGRDASRIFTPEDRAAGQIRKEMEAALGEGFGVDERWHMKKGDERFWASGEMMPLREDDGRQVGFVKILRDRTDQHLAGVRLEELQGQLAQAQEAGGVGLCTVEIATGTLTATPGFSRLYGLPHLDTRPADDFGALVIPEDRHLVSSDATRRTGEAPTDVTYRIRRADTGEVRWIERKGDFQRGGDGRPVRFVGTARDVTDQVASRRRQDMLLATGDRLRDLTEPAEIAFVACEALASALGAGLVGYGDVDPLAETITVERDWTAPGVASLAGTLRFRDFGSYVEDLQRGETVIVRDCETDPRTRDFAEALKERHARAFVNMPVIERGVFVALLYVSTDRPRDWTAEELAFVHDVADRVRVATEKVRGDRALRESDERQRLALSIGEVGTFDLDLSTGFVILDERARAAFGVLDGRLVTQGEKLGAVHPDDRAAFDAVFRAAAAGGTFDLQFRTVGVDDAKVRWVALKGRVIGGARFIGAVLDVTERVEADERRAVLNAELAHRLKNNLALVQSIATQTLRSAPDMATARTALTERIGALAKAHDILVVGRRDAGDLRAIVASAVALHDEGGRVRLEGPAVLVGPKAALTLSLIVHELSTNAVKYGSLSVEAGHVEVDWSIADDLATRRPTLTFEWREVGGPPVTPPTKTSFGMRLIGIGVSGAAEGTSEITYAPEGLRCRIVASLTELQADDEAPGGR
ncbi:PAS domain-containing sensor histidine kinase [Aureimonas leprariae]|uniref:PAS domain-containing sensor histidine kinase n=1 Tax=Plantimonas leprariae TaxID=2615207 RepID=UPI001FE6D42D|nr:PAS domain S-box protein [Aureimonas leprariae]